MHLLLLGYGKMGKAIEKVALQRGHTTLGVDLDNRQEILSTLVPNKFDAAIEFTQADAAPANIRFCLKNKLPVISGTTGWLKEKSAVEDYCIEQDGTFFYASNFSIGVNIFFRLNTFLANIMKNYAEYKPSLEEIHHTQKKDAPSGTAISLAEGMLQVLTGKNDWHLEGRTTDPGTQSIPVTSLRQGDVAGTHSVRYHSPIDTLEIKHQAHSREGFAQGAVLVAEWIKNKKGILGMNDYLKL